MYDENSSIPSIWMLEARDFEINWKKIKCTITAKISRSILPLRDSNSLYFKGMILHKYLNLSTLNMYTCNKWAYGPSYWRYLCLCQKQIKFITKYENNLLQILQQTNLKIQVKNYHIWMKNQHRYLVYYCTHLHYFTQSKWIGIYKTTG